MGSLAVLAAAAFVLGAGAGLLWKAPGLVMAPWSGGAQEVAWSDVPAEPLADADASEGGPLPEVEVPSREAAQPAREAAGPAPVAQRDAPYQTASAEPVRPLAQGERRTAPAPQAEARPEPAAEEARLAAATPPVSAPPPRSGVAVQVGAFSERSKADQLVSRLEAKGFPAYAAAGDGGAWRVRVGPYRDRGGADAAAARLQRDEKLPTWVLQETGDR